MTAGLPGTGIGGLFYILAALIAPLRRSAKRSALYPAGLAICVLVGMFATGWMLGLALGPAARPANSFAAIPLPLRFGHVQNVLRWAALASSGLVLAAVLSIAQLARVWQRRWGK